MPFPQTRSRRLRGSPALRHMVTETRLPVESLIYPLFVAPGKGVRNPVSSMPEVFQLSVDELVKEAQQAHDLGISMINLFGVPDKKDLTGKLAADPDGLIPQAIRAVKKAVPGLLVMTDVCLCDWLEHGHCGLVKDGAILNDETLPVLASMAMAHAKAGVDMVSPSDMMDGRVAAIRRELDAGGFSHLPIMAYSAKYASGFYGPFREAAQSAPQFGDRAGYQMDPANAREALREVLQDVAESADIVMVKPAMPYLDIIHQVKAATNIPVAAYQVSGEYSMMWAAHQKGWLDLDRVMMESLIGIRRAGADVILTYFAKRVAKKLRGEK
ncbi:MAG: porphobilinogen synthase [Deltaproteobacteria bacterium]|nr:porphobilinogen synthase [Deltaproteobacteria bacterium]